MYNLLKKKSSGFSLIELIVVIAIIGILATVVLASLSSARGKGRDSKRVTDLKQLQLALKLYYEANGRYPEKCDTGSSWAGDGSGSNNYSCNDSNDEWIMGLAPAYIAVLPSDPKPGNSSNLRYLYRVNGAGTEYKIMANHTMETKSVASKGDEWARYNSTCSQAHTEDTYAIYADISPGGDSGAECW